MAEPTARSGYNVAVGMDLSKFDRGIGALKRSAGRVSGALGGMKRSLGSVADSVFSLKNAIIGGLVAGAFYKLTQAIATVAKASSDAQEIQSKFAVVFGSLRGEAERWADTYSGQVKRSRTATREWMAALQDTFVPLGMARRESFELGKQVVQLATDLSSFHNTNPQEAFERIQSALAGNHETVRKFSTFIDEATLKSMAYATGIAKSGEELTNLQKVLARLRIIQDANTFAQGDAIRTADQYANSTRGVGAMWEDLQKRLGDFITTSPAVATLINSLGDGFRNVEEWIGKNSAAIQAWVDRGVKVLSGWIQTAAHNIRQFVEKGGLVAWAHRVAIAFSAIKLLGQLAWSGVRHMILLAVEAGLAFLRTMQAGENWFTGFARMVYGVSEADAAYAKVSGTYEGIIKDVERLRDQQVVAAADANDAVLETLATIQRHADAVNNAAFEWREYQKAVEEAADKEGQAAMDAALRAKEAREDALRAARNALKDVARYADKTWKKETGSLERALKEQVKLREKWREKSKDIQRDATADWMDFFERMQDLRIERLSGAKQMRAIAELGRDFRRRGQNLMRVGEWEDARAALAKAMERAEDIASRTRGRSRRGALKEMERLHKLRQRAFREQEKTLAGKADKAQAEVQKLVNAVDELRAKAMEKLEIATNFPELSAQVDELRRKLDALHGKVVEVTVRQVEGHAAGGWIGGGVPGRDSVPALLAPGEFVVAARQAQANRELLERINAGFVVPSRYAQGGSVPGSAAAARESTTVNVSFYGPGDKQYARQVVIPAIEQAVQRGQAGRLNVLKGAR